MSGTGRNTNPGQDALPEELYADVVQLYGRSRATIASTVREGEPCLAVARIDLGNVVLLPPAAAVGDDAFAIVHAPTSPAPPLHRRHLGARRFWSRCDDSLRHARQSGILATQKQVAPAATTGPTVWGNHSHSYYYTIGNVGEKA